MKRFYLLFPSLLLALIGTAFCATAQSVCFEAEAAADLEEPLVKTVSDADQVSGGAFLEIKQGAGDPPNANGAGKITFEVPESKRYYLWCRVWWLDACGNSIGINIDDAKAFTFGQDRTFKSWHWVQAPTKLPQFELEAGEHTLHLSHREDGVRIDQILLTANKRYIPVGTEKITYVPDPTAAGWNELTADGKTAHLPSRVGWE